MPHIDAARYPHVVRAIESGNTSLVREYARRGGINSGIARRKRRAEEQRRRELEDEAWEAVKAEHGENLARQDWNMRCSANEHIIPLSTYD